MIRSSSKLARHVLYAAARMFLLDWGLWAIAGAAVLCAIAAWAIAAWLVERRISDTFERDLTAARKAAERRGDEQTADPLERG